MIYRSLYTNNLCKGLEKTEKYQKMAFSNAPYFQMAALTFMHDLIDFSSVLCFVAYTGQDCIR